MAILLEWILARMVLHPVIQAKVQAEIDNVVGSSRSVSDFVLPNLPYLRAVVRETLRVLPPGPLLIIFTAAINILTKISCVCVYQILQAYTVEMELELDQLKEDNAKLKQIVVKLARYHLSLQIV